ncbi:MAG: copper chaperone PCu(A)C [Alphaproteobacteria bacterium]
MTIGGAFRAVAVAAVVAVVMLPAQALAAEGLTVDKVWARIVPGAGDTGAVFMTITNGGSKADALTGAATDVAKMAELHTHIHEGEVMRMRKVDSIPVPAGGTVALKPGGDHVMLMGLTRPVKPGDMVPLTLTFRDGGTVAVQAHVMGPGAMQMDHGSMDHGHMKH